MVSEPHVAGTEFGELQLAMWTRQFRPCATATGSSTATIRSSTRSPTEFGIDFRNSLADVIVANTQASTRADLADNVFRL